MAGFHQVGFQEPECGLNTFLKAHKHLFQLSLYGLWVRSSMNSVCGTLFTKHGAHRMGLFFSGHVRISRSNKFFPVQDCVLFAERKCDARTCNHLIHEGFEVGLALVLVIEQLDLISVELHLIFGKNFETVLLDRFKKAISEMPAKNIGFNPRKSNLRTHQKALEDQVELPSSNRQGFRAVNSIFYKVSPVSGTKRTLFVLLRLFGVCRSTQLQPALDTIVLS
mmetsp:Transcript_4631/g.8877  ORF Transcript_4631/g.8877 Transcript_4631/m.8877 type:complete len:223 (-) Transcript_4631:7118-7786(-)